MFASRVCQVSSTHVVLSRPRSGHISRQKHPTDYQNATVPSEHRSLLRLRGMQEVPQ